jgi:hypothetical protein
MIGHPQSVSAYDTAYIITEFLGFLYGVNYLAVDIFAEANRRLLAVDVQPRKMGPRASVRELFI